MYEKLTYTNSLGQSIEIASNTVPYRLISFDSGKLVDDPEVHEGYHQDGNDYDDAYAKVRDMEINFVVFGNGFADMQEKRRTLKRILNPKLGEGTLEYKNDYINKEIIVKIDAEISFDMRYHASVCGFTMTAHNPYWRDLEYTEVELAGLSNPFYWDDPEYFYDVTPFYLGEISSASKTMGNNGDVKAPLIIEWVGAATNPKITLLDTGEYILLDKALGADEKLIIYTEYGNKAVWIKIISTGEQIKDFSIVNPDSDFFSLPIGNQTISLSADAGADAAAVTVKYKNLYNGV